MKILIRIIMGLTGAVGLTGCNSCSKKESQNVDPRLMMYAQACINDPACQARAAFWAQNPQMAAYYANNPAIAGMIQNPGSVSTVGGVPVIPGQGLPPAYPAPAASGNPAMAVQLQNVKVQAAMQALKDDPDSPFYEAPSRSTASVTSAPESAQVSVSAGGSGPPLGDAIR